MIAHHCGPAAGGEVHHGEALELFCRPDAVATELNEALAADLPRERKQFQAAPARDVPQRGILRADIVRNQVKSPVQWLVGSVRMLECDLPPTLVSCGMLRQLGQDLFAPPNVKGWDGGITWITTNTLLDALQ